MKYGDPIIAVHNAWFPTKSTQRVVLPVVHRGHQRGDSFRSTVKVLFCLLDVVEYVSQWEVRIPLPRLSVFVCLEHCMTTWETSQLH